MLSVSPQSLQDPTQFSFEQSHTNVSKLLLSATRSRTLPKGLQLHAHIIKSGLQNIPLISHYLINFYSKTQLPIDSQQVFEGSHIKSSTTWSSIISSFAQNELPVLALQYFKRMIENGVRPDDHIFPSATKASAILSSCDIGRSVHCLALKTGYDIDVFVGSSVVDMYSKCGKIEDARKLFDEMPMKNVVSWSGMIYGYAQLGENEEALWLFKQALFENLDVNDFTFTSVICVCGNTTLLGLGKQLHGLCVKLSFDSSSFIGSSLISMYSKCGMIEIAYRVFDDIRIRNLGMWNAMLLACAQHTHTNKVFNLFKEMESSGMTPNFITFLVTLYACSHSGLVEKGKYYFNLMKQYGIEPGDQHYASMVDILARANKVQEALAIIKEMPMLPTKCIWGALLTGCRLHGNTELAAYAADKVFELGPVSSGIHFKSKDIYKKLEELEVEMEKVGYVADTSYVLREVGDEEKNMAIRYHSERLAIAFALITFQDKRPIRIMKNLRICGDCHTAIKFMSKCCERVIIVRDNNRFHRFEDGKCTTPSTVSNEEWWEETDKKFQAWPRTAGPPVVMNPISRQNFIVKSRAES
ncbi:hypothetical protein E3N88_22242 [Mikania micrantha]|uniref:DYW domain-containing protein n=1 Tax=Mikania micrantha TaxID=192012 RepID=A0A5N6N9Y1_9ASTR|nr:hypothetical protein E3N88_22242 [Mikania micrantha]